jgi:hypothetical protein
MYPGYNGSYGISGEVGVFKMYFGEILCCVYFGVMALGPVMLWIDAVYRTGKG